MKRKIKKFDELTINELYNIMKLRSIVFVLEQECPYQDVDDKDQVAYHLFCEDEGQIVACLRVLPRGVTYEEVCIGRVVADKSYRQTGLGYELVKRGIDFIENELGEDKIRISGQNYLMNFYQKLGFKIVSEIYLEDHIEHREMLYTSMEK